jgi:beta-lactam-binding protein with PASTA domain
MEKQEAIELIKDLGVEYEIIGNGETVISQVPCKNSTIYKKTGKIILYTDGKDITHSIVPDVMGKSAEEANKILSNAGFNINIIGANNFAFGQGAVVVNQFPIADTYYQKGEVVTIEMLFTDEKE